MPSALASTSPPHFPAERAFIVKFSDDPAAGTQGLCGRVEHLVSGRQAAFSSMEELAVAIVECQTGAPTVRSDA